MTIEHPLASELPQLRQRDYWPTRQWKNVPPLALGANPRVLGELHKYACDSLRIYSLLIVQGGRLVFERYYHGWSPRHYITVNSVTKSVVSALVGIALREGYLQSLDQRLLDFFPEYTQTTPDARKQQITLRHLLNLSSGYAEESIVHKKLDRSPTAEVILDRPLTYEPGSTFSYDGLSCHLLSLILTKVTGMSTAEYAYSRLFQPLGIWQNEQGQPVPWKNAGYVADSPHLFFFWDDERDALWSVDSEGYYIGSSGLQLTPREMAKFGYLYLNGGWWDQQEIIPTWYVQESAQQHGSIKGYGYLWWLGERQGHRCFTAHGAGGHAVMVVPDLDLVAVITSSPGDEEHVETVLRDYVIPAVEG